MSNTEIDLNPYKDLYIYYLEGLLGSETRLDEDGFIGNWEEDGFSFLFFPDLRMIKSASWWLQNLN